ncbi:MAG: 2-phospho-L-lactate transferase [Chloroflexi bacterium]|nr:2-phospho-L-lactate transferase [Chloroflexota bacterium]
MSQQRHVVLLVGGVGGAKLALGLSHSLQADELTIIVNTADDFEHLGLHISPDLDTVMYTLAEIANPQTGWGVINDSYRALDMLRRYDETRAWFRLGDLDLGTNLMRTAMLGKGLSLTDVTRHLSRSLGIAHNILPMSNDPVRTIIETPDGDLPFQVYFVRERWQPIVTGIRFDGAAQASASAAALSALASASLIVFGPSNPFLSIDPILAIPAMRSAIAERKVPCMAVSPIVGGRALKGPAAKLMQERGIDVSPLGVAAHYDQLIDGMIIDRTDAHLSAKIEAMGLRTAALPTVMRSISDKIKLAEQILDWVEP